MDGKFIPLLPQKSKMGKWHIFAFMRLDLGGWVVLFHFILSKFVAFEQALCLAEGG